MYVTGRMWRYVWNVLMAMYVTGRMGRYVWSVLMVLYVPCMLQGGWGGAAADSGSDSDLSEGELERRRRQLLQQLDLE